ncbi:MAG: flagellar motor stator protein MotA [bacterium]|nr:flagellar motor stator protein MotA [bacterium]
MNLIIGLVVVFGCVVTGFVLEGGHIGVLWQPVELLILGGAAFGAMIIANPFSVLKRVLSSIPSLLKGDLHGKDDYLQLFAMMGDVFNKIRRQGLVAIEQDIGNPESSEIFSKYPKLLQNHHTIEFIQDYLRLVVSGSMNTFQLENLMDVELSTHHHEAEQPAQAVSRVADALPGFGIVAAVLGIVITMGSLGGEAEEIGHKVAVALIGTFMGILFAYGVFGPLSNSLERRAREEADWYTAIKTCFMASLQGYAPQIALEFGRKTVPPAVRPSFEELSAFLRGSKKE